MDDKKLQFIESIQMYNVISYFSIIEQTNREKQVKLLIVIIRQLLESDKYRQENYFKPNNCLGAHCQRKLIDWTGQGG